MGVFCGVGLFLVVWVSVFFFFFFRFGVLDVWVFLLSFVFWSWVVFVFFCTVFPFIRSFCGQHDARLDFNCLGARLVSATLSVKPLSSGGIPYFQGGLGGVQCKLERKDNRGSFVLFFCVCVFSWCFGVVVLVLVCFVFVLLGCRFFFFFYCFTLLSSLSTHPHPFRYSHPFCFFRSRFLSENFCLVFPSRTASSRLVSEQSSQRRLIV